MTTMLSAQTESDCDQLAIQFRGLVESEESDQLLILISN
ncbi:MAG: hypothetical protein ACI94Y_002671 [Maribacter sp.]|jgi:hypothetical protein